MRRAGRGAPVSRRPTASSASITAGAATSSGCRVVDCTPWSPCATFAPPSRSPSSTPTGGRRRRSTSPSGCRPDLSPSGGAGQGVGPPFPDVRDALAEALDARPSSTPWTGEARPRLSPVDAAARRRHQSMLLALAVLTAGSPVTGVGWLLSIGGVAAIALVLLGLSPVRRWAPRDARWWIRSRHLGDERGGRSARGADLLDRSRPVRRSLADRRGTRPRARRRACSRDRRRVVVTRSADWGRGGLRSPRRGRRPAGGPSASAGMARSAPRSTRVRPRW